MNGEIFSYPLYTRIEIVQLETGIPFNLFYKYYNIHFLLVYKIKFNLASFLFLFGLILFGSTLRRKTIPLVILEEGSYEKDVLLYVNLGEPQMVGGNILFSLMIHHQFIIEKISKTNY